MKRGRTQEAANEPLPRKHQKTGGGAGSAHQGASPNKPPTAQQQQQQQFKQLKVEDALAYLDQVKLKFRDQPHVYDRFLEIMKDFKSQSIDTPGVIARVSELFKGHDNLILGFNTFLPPGYKIEMNSFKPGTSTTSSAAGAGQQESAAKSNRDKNQQQQQQQQQESKNKIDFDQAISYVTKIKTRFNDQPEIYKAFLDILHTYQKEQTTIRKVYEQVAVLFKDHNDLLNEFTLFLPETPATAGADGQQRTSGKGANKKKQEPAKKKKGSAKLRKNEEEYEEDDYENRREFAQANINKFGPSYRSLPKNYNQPKCSERSELCNEVLNDELVSMPAGSEESSVHRKSIYDEIVFQCEDDRTILDIVIEQNLSTIRFLEPLAQKLESDPTAKFKLDQLRDIHRASIARIYAEKANEVLEGMRKNPAAAIPVILSRLRQKDEEWKQARRGLNKFWRDIYEKNYQKAMEEQCANFKQMDKKALNPKNILSDIEERYVYSKELTSLMDDEQIHHIIYALLEHVGELSGEDMDAARKLWVDVIVPFFNIKPYSPPASQASDSKSEYHLPMHYLTSLIEDQKKADTSTLFTPIVERDLNKKSNRHVLFGNIPMMLFFRYYIFAYDRLKKVKELAQKQMKRVVAPSATADIIRQHDSMTLPVTGTNTSDKNSTTESSGTSAVKPPQDYFSLFLCTLVQYFTDNMDTAAFEDECKRLLGYQCWVMMTFDKLFANLQKQLQNINADDACGDLIKAFKYEYQRANHFLDNSYYIQAHRIVGPAPCYVFSYNLHKHKLVLGLTDRPVLDHEKVSAEEKGLQYIQQYLSNMNKDVEASSHIFLRRNKKRLASAPLTDLVLVNGLECKVCIATFKLFYVEDTSDLLYRKKKSGHVSSSSWKQKQSARFKAFMDKRQPEMIREAEEKEKQQQPQATVDDSSTTVDTTHELNSTTTATVANPPPPTSTSMEQ